MVYIIVEVVRNHAVSRMPAAPLHEYQIKSVVLYNFAQFVEWPVAAFSD